MTNDTQERSLVQWNTLLAVNGRVDSLAPWVRDFITKKLQSTQKCGCAELVRALEWIEGCQSRTHLENVRRIAVDALKEHREDEAIQIPSTPKEKY